MIRSAFGWKAARTHAAGRWSRRTRRWTLAPVVAAVALVWPGIGEAQTARPSASSVPDVCEIGDVEQMSTSSARRIDYAGTWVLDLSRSEGLPAYWWGATSATMVVTQDAKRLTSALTVVVPGRDTMAYTPISYNLDGSLHYARGDAPEHIKIGSDLHYTDGGRSLVLRSTQLALLTTERWEVAEGGRALRVCRMLKAPRTRTVSKLFFIRK